MIKVNLNEELFEFQTSETIKYGKANKPLISISLNIYDEWIKIRPVVVIEEVYIQGIKHKVFLKMGSQYELRDLTKEPDNFLRSIYAKANEIHTKIYEPIINGDFVDPKNQWGKSEMVDCARTYVMPENEFKSLFPKPLKLKDLNSLAIYRILQRWHLLFEETLPFQALIHISLNYTNKMRESQLLYAHPDLIQLDAWIKGLGNNEIDEVNDIFFDNRNRLTRYEKVTYLMPELLKVNFKKGWGYEFLNWISNEIYHRADQMGREFGLEIQHTQIKKSAIWDKNYAELNIAHLLNNFKPQDPFQGEDPAAIDADYQNRKRPYIEIIDEPIISKTKSR